MSLSQFTLQKKLNYFMRKSYKLIFQLDMMLKSARKTMSINREVLLIYSFWHTITKRKKEDYSCLT